MHVGDWAIIYLFRSIDRLNALGCVYPSRHFPMYDEKMVLNFPTSQYVCTRCTSTSKETQQQPKETAICHFWAFEIWGGLIFLKLAYGFVFWPFSCCVCAQQVVTLHTAAKCQILVQWGYTKSITEVAQWYWKFRVPKIWV